MSKKSNWACFILLILEATSLYKFQSSNLMDTFFTWGIIEVLLALTFVFGFENKMINNATGKSENGSYIQNTNNYIAASTKDFFKKETDISTGKKVIIMGIVNLLIYFILTVI